jgi:hypothetical protein
MFDDINTPQSKGTVPPNLPMGEPEDIFSGLQDPEDVPGMPAPASLVSDPSDIPVSSPQSSPLTPPAPVSALGAGVLRPVQSSPDVILPEEMTSPNQQGMPGRPATMTSAQEFAQGQDLFVTSSDRAIKTPGVGKGIMIAIVTVVILVILGGGSLLIYTNFIVGGGGEGVTPANSRNPVPIAPVVQDSIFNEPDEFEDGVGQEVFDNEGVTADIIDDAVLFGEPIDRDGDGLDDSRELVIGTDPDNWDSDGDELSDGDEVIIWKTDPLNPDTDGDSFLDGQEVINGFSPSGPGRLFEPPTSTES